MVRDLERDFGRKVLKVLVQFERHINLGLQGISEIDFESRPQIIPETRRRRSNCGYPKLWPDRCAIGEGVDRSLRDYQGSTRRVLNLFIR